MLSREAVAATIALAGVRSGGKVLVVVPSAPLRAAAAAAAGSGGRVDDVASAAPAGRHGSALTYGYAFAVSSRQDPAEAVASLRNLRPLLAPAARVTVGSAGSLATLTQRLADEGWTVLHSVALDEPTHARRPRRALALAVARAGDRAADDLRK